MRAEISANYAEPTQPFAMMRVLDLHQLSPTPHPTDRSG
jgi:hypothetical protein